MRFSNFGWKDELYHMIIKNVSAAQPIASNAMLVLVTKHNTHIPGYSDCSSRYGSMATTAKHSWCKSLTVLYWDPVEHCQRFSKQDLPPRTERRMWRREESRIDTSLKEQARGVCIVTVEQHTR